MKIEVHFKESSFVIQCATGANQISWLANVSLIYYQQTNKKYIAERTPVKLCKNTGEQLKMYQKISSYLSNGDSVYVYMKEDVQFYQLGKVK